MQGHGGVQVYGASGLGRLDSPDGFQGLDFRINRNRLGLEAQGQPYREHKESYDG